MNLAILTARYILYFNIGTMLLLLVLALFAELPIVPTLSFLTLNLVLIGIIYLLIRKGFFWAGVAYGILCFPSFFGVFSDGLALSNIPNIINAVLSFVFIMAMFRWWRERRSVKISL